MPQAAPGFVPQVAPGFGPLHRMLRQRWFVALRAFALFTLLWWAFFVWNSNPLQLPSPVRVVAALGSLVPSGEIFEHALISTSRLLIAFGIAIAMAVPLGFWMGLGAPPRPSSTR